MPDVNPPRAAEAGPPPGRTTTLLRTHRTMLRVRWVAAAFAALQVTTYYLPYPPGMLAAAAALVVVLVLGNVALWYVGRGVGDHRRATRLAVAALVLDTGVATGLVFVYTFDPNTAIFAVLYILPLEGASFFQLRGAVATTAAAGVLYIVREAYGALFYGTDFLVVSITFRLGIGGIIAVVAGMMAQGLLTEQEALEVRNAELRTARRVQDDFIAATNHELRTPLTAILGYASTLQRRWGTLTDQAKRSAVDHMALQSRRLLELVDEVLTLSAASSGGLHVAVQDVALPAALTGAIRAAGVAAEVEVRCPDDVAVRADPRRLTQVLVNLLANAGKYGRPPIRVLAGEVPAAGPDDERRIRIVVEDEGDGVPEEFVPLLFERFTQARSCETRGGGGSGLGLAIVRSLVVAQGGEVRYEPRRPHGSRFVVELPAAPAHRTVPVP